MSSFKQSQLVKIDFNPEVRKGFPLVIDDTTLAFRLGIRTKTMWYLLHKRNKKTAYKCFTIPQFNKDGTFKKGREIQEPMEHLKNVHKVLNNLFSKIKMDPAISAYVRERSCADAAQMHVRQSFSFDVKRAVFKEEAALQEDPRFECIEVNKDSHDVNSPRMRKYHQPITMIKMDLKNFFPSIKASWIRKFFIEDVGYNFYVSSLLASLCSVKRTLKDRKGKYIEVRHLPQGSPLSGSLANLVGFHMFGSKVKSYLESHSKDWVFTIYSDDIILTHPSNTLPEGEAEKVRDAVISIITESGFVINDKKTMIRESRKGRIKVLGCIVTDRLNVPKNVRNYIATRIFNCKTSGFESQCGPNQTVQGFIMHLKGNIEYVRSVRPDLAEKFSESLKEAMEVQNYEVSPESITGRIC